MSQRRRPNLTLGQPPRHVSRERLPYPAPVKSRFLD